VRTVLSVDPEAMTVPSGEKATEHTIPVCPSKTASRILSIRGGRRLLIQYIGVLVRDQNNLFILKI